MLAAIRKTSKQYGPLPDANHNNSATDSVFFAPSLSRSAESQFS